MGSNLNDHQLNIDCHMQKRSYTNLMVTMCQNPVNLAIEINIEYYSTLKKAGILHSTEKRKNYLFDEIFRCNVQESLGLWTGL